jgi:colanic acid/amylovoran biosynthesis glycosyltransferase
MRLLARRPGLLRTLDASRHGRTASSLQLLYWGSRLAPRAAYDVVYCHYGWNGLYASMLEQAGLLGGRLVTAFHGADLSWHLATSGADVYRPLFRSGDLFLPISEHWKEKLVEIGCPAERIRVHHMGIDCDRLAFLERRLEPGRPVRLITIGRLVEKKGIEHGIRAVARLVERHHDVRYDIIGDGPLAHRLGRLVGELQLGDRVTLVGSRDQDDVRAALERAHVALAPSVTSRDGDQEGIPVALMEAMACGLPVVASLHSGIPELVEDGVSGRLVPEGDDQALADALEQLLRHPETWPAIGRAGRRRVEEGYDIEALNDRLVEILGEQARDRATASRRRAP